MLVLTTYQDEWLYITVPGLENPIKIKPLQLKRSHGTLGVRLAFDADPEVIIDRQSVYLSKMEGTNS